MASLKVAARLLRFPAILRLFDLFEAYVLDSVFRREYLLANLPVEDRMCFLKTNDPVMYGAIALAIKRIEKEAILGSFAEAGVYKGHTSRFIHELARDRTLYLFDTFEGFSANDIEREYDPRFRDTSVEVVKRNMGDLRNVHIIKGHFPETAKGLEMEKFAFVRLDMDLYKSTLAGLNFFYPRLAKGGYLFLHDYNNDESDWAVSRATTSFFEDKEEKIVEIPDMHGSAIIRKT